VAAKTDSYEKQLPDQNWKRHPVITMWEEEKVETPGAAQFDESPLVIEEAPVVGDVEKPCNYEQGESNQHAKQPSSSDIAQSFSGNRFCASH
jgi:hypothetical protein